MNETCKDRYLNLCSLAERILTPVQFKVFELVGKEGQSFRIVGKKMGFSKPRVHAVWYAASRKVQEAWERGER